MHYDLLVVGAGPAGSMVAQIVARANYRVLLIDRKRVIGQPLQCAEYVPALLSREIELPADSVAICIKYSILHTPDRKCFQFVAPGYILNRVLFDKWLSINALKDGAELWLNTKFMRFTNGYAILQKENVIVKIKAKIIVGADGPLSTVCRIINKKYEGYVIGFQQEFPLVRPTDFTEIYFDKRFFGGYAWFFPKRYSANVGLGIRLKHNCAPELKELFTLFVKKLVRQKKILPSPVATITGLIPVAGPVKSVEENFVLVGDAAGQTHPITGAGISQAIICGKLAGRAIINALRTGNMRELHHYECEWHKLYYDELKRAVEKRKMMELKWNSLEKYFKKYWVSFPQYYA